MIEKLLKIFPYICYTVARGYAGFLSFYCRILKKQRRAVYPFSIFFAENPNTYYPLFAHLISAPAYFVFSDYHTDFAIYNNKFYRIKIKGAARHCQR